MKLVLTLWPAVAAEVLGFEKDEALTLGRAVAGLNAYSKEVKEQRRKMRKEETVTLDLLHHAVPAKHTDERLRALSGESPIHPAGNWHPCRDLIQRQMIHAMRIVVFLFSGVFLWATLADAVPASVASSGRPEARLDGELYLYEKNPSDGSIVPGGAWGKMSYAREGTALEFVFSAYHLRPGVSYTLIYFPGPWPAEGLVCLATATGDSEGTVQVKGSVPIAHLPAKYDANYAAGAKIRLVLSDDIDWGKGGSMARKRMRRWNPTQYLLEAKLINFSITRAGCNAPGQKSGTFP